MQDMQNFKKTERFAVEEAEREQVWQEKYGAKMDEVIYAMNNLLKEGTENSRLKLHDMFLNQDFFEHYKQTDVVAIMYIIMEIYERERMSDIYPTILECGKTVEELQGYLEQLKFILYRIDFSIDSKSEQELVAYLKKYQTSTITIETMITTVAMRPMELTLKLERIFEKFIMYKELFSIRNFINERWKGNHRILMKLAEIYEKTGHDQYAQECLEQIPDKLRTLYRTTTSTLQLQEILWKIRYRDMTALGDITRTLQICRITEDTWGILLMHEAVDSEEYYLFLAEEFLKKNMLNFAMKTLSVGELVIPQNEVIGGLLTTCERRMVK